MNRQSRPWRLVATVAAAVIAVDQMTKIWAVSALDNQRIDIVWTLRLRLIRNFGSAFGLGSGAGLGRWIGLLVLPVVLVVLWWARDVADRRILALFGLIVGGAVGNMIDRVVRADDGFLSGGVIDFIDLQWWPVFNVADIAVVCGAALLAIVGFSAPEDTVDERDVEIAGNGEPA